MSAHTIWNNLLAYSLQVGVLVAVAGCLPAMLRLRQPKPRLMFWQMALAACLLLPLVRPWRTEVADGLVRVATGAVTVASAQSTHARGLDIPWTEIALAAVALGICVRLGMLGIGFLRLSRYRRRSAPMAGTIAWGSVSVRVSSDVEGPVTFGLTNPVILLPQRFPQLDASTRDAILHHEMLHVARLDWLSTVFEELVRAAFWFHPAIWWLLGEIKLTREQAVDREVIAATNASEQYVDALLAIARAENGFDLAPAFLRRRQLKQRVVAILQETGMQKNPISRTRVLSTMALAASLLAGACWVVTGAFPLRAQSRAVVDDNGVSVDTFGAALQHRSSVMYPEEARLKHIEGTVVAQLRLSSTGTVTDAQILSGPDELRNGVLHSLLDWHFSKDLAGTTRQVAVTFRAPAAPAPPASGPVTVQGANGPMTIDVLRESKLSTPNQVAGGAAQTISRVVFQEGLLTDDQKAKLASIAPVGTQLTPDKRSEIMAAVRDIDEHYSASFLYLPQGGVTISVGMRPGARVPGQFYSLERALPQNGVVNDTINGIPAPPPPPAAVTGTQPRVEGPLVVGGRVQSMKLITHVDPIYPQIAKNARIQGTVVLQVQIGLDGTVQNIAVISGHPMLQQAALQAVRQWVYTPTYLNNEPVAVTTTVEVSFTLSQ